MNYMSNALQPIYSKIAIDLAARIAKGEYKENTKIHGRSVLAGQYKVSPETVRRALRLLVDMDIIKSIPGSGYIITSRENAIRYVDKFNTGKDFRDLKNELKQLFKEREAINNKILETIDQILDVGERFRHTNPLYTLEFEIPEGSPVCGKTINEINFWHITSATIVAIKRQGKMILSPGPYHEFMPNDIIIVTGEPEISQRINALLQG